MFDLRVRGRYDGAMGGQPRRSNCGNTRARSSSCRRAFAGTARSECGSNRRRRWTSRARECYSIAASHATGWRASGSLSRSTRGGRCGAAGNTSARSFAWNLIPARRLLGRLRFEIIGASAEADPGRERRRLGAHSLRAARFSFASPELPGPRNS